MLRRREPRVPSFYDRAARVLIALPFLADGIVRVVRPERAAELLSGYGLAMPELVNHVAAAVELTGGSLLVLGIAVYPVAVLLAISILPATFLSRLLLVPEHPSMLLHVFRDLAISGGLLLVAGVHRRDRRGEHPDVGRDGDPLPTAGTPARPEG